MDIFYILLFSLTVLVYLYIIYKRFIHSTFMLQLSHYHISDFFNWFYNNKTNKKIICPIIISLLSLIVLIFPMNILIYLELPLGLLTLPFIEYKQEKKKLKITNRVIRIFCFCLTLTIGIIVLTFLLLNNFISIYSIILIILLILNFAVHDILLLGLLCSLPIERSIQNNYIAKARSKILENDKLQVIGITGSYGKTSTKHIISEVLKNQLNVCVTPNSFNTPMGITMTINDQLKNIDDIFICEMGARKEFEIKELCDIAFPKVGILTSIGPQHLETFKSLKNIIKTKFELIESLPKNGVAFLNYDNYHIRNYYVKNQVKIITYGIEQENVDYLALNIHYGIFGSTFEVQFPNKARSFFKTKLLGKHNIYNILAVIALADYLKLNLMKVKYVIENLSPVCHRLELKVLSNYNIIDDSFNANIEGVVNALDILSNFENKKIIITPGMIELGAVQYEQNYRFGEKIASVCDYVVLVGKKQTKPILDALIDKKYPVNQIYQTNNFNEGMNKIVDSFKEKFTVLIENDLPDNYNEN